MDAPCQARRREQSNVNDADARGFCLKKRAFKWSTRVGPPPTIHVTHLISSTLRLASVRVEIGVSTEIVCATFIRQYSIKNRSYWGGGYPLRVSLVPCHFPLSQDLVPLQRRSSSSMGVRNRRSAVRALPLASLTGGPKDQRTKGRERVSACTVLMYPYVSLHHPTPTPTLTLPSSLNWVPDLPQNAGSQR